MSIGNSGSCGDNAPYEDVLETISSSLAGTYETQKEIYTLFDERLGKLCDHVDECIDAIVKAIDEKYAGAAKTCDECKAMVANGMGGTIEYALACASSCASDVSSSCSPGDGKQDGSTCTGCGKEPCCCKDNACVPCGEDKTDTFVAYCNPTTGSVIVGKQGEIEAGEGFFLIATGSDLDIVTAQANAQCTQTSTGVAFPPLIQPPGAKVNVQFANCSIEQYASGDAIRAIASNNAGALNADSIAKLYEANSKFPVLGVGFDAIASLLGGMWEHYAGTDTWFMTAMVDGLSQTLSCTSDNFKDCVKLVAAFDACEKQIGMNLQEFTSPLYYAMHAECRNRMLSPGEAMQAFLAKAFEQDTLDTHYAINGLCPAAAQWAVQAHKSKPSVDQLVRMRHRGILDEQQYSDQMRPLGYIDDGVAETIYQIAESLPDVSAIVGIVSHGGTNDNQANELGLDYGFEAFDTEQVKKWTESAGLKPETVKALWRSHWQTPGIGQLTEMYRRLHGDDSVDSEGELFGQIQSAYDSLAIPPFWRKFYNAMLLEPLTRRDIHNVYVTGSMTRDELKTAIAKTGHDADANSKLTDTLDKQRAVAILNHIAIRNWTKQQIDGTKCRDMLDIDGFESGEIDHAMENSEYEFAHSTWAEAFAKGSIDRTTFENLLTNQGVTQNGASSLAGTISYRIVDHQHIRDFVAGQISQATAVGQMTTDGMPQPVAQKMINDASSAVTDSQLLECIRGIKHRYMLGEMDSQEAANYLIRFGLEAARTNTVVSGFDCERSAEGTKVPVAKLCEWLGLGAIGPDEFLQRLHRLGYTDVNASLLLADCSRNLTIKQMKEAAKAVKEEVAAAEKIKRALDKAEATRLRELARLTAARAKQARLRQARDKQLLSASEKLYKILGGSLSASIDGVRYAVGQGQTRFGLALDESLPFAILAAETKGIKTMADYQSAFEALATAAAASTYTPPLAPSVSGDNVNGSTQPSSPQ